MLSLPIGRVQLIDAKPLDAVRPVLSFLLV